jgi:alcohol dehydrogenase class IV
MQFEFATANRIVFGPGTLSAEVTAVADYGRHALVVTGKSRRHYQTLARQLEAQNVSSAVFAVTGEPDTLMIEEGSELARSAGCDVIVGIGGGSVVDAGKAIAALTANPGRLMDYLEVIGKGRPLQNAPIPYIAVPTTAGTGAEVTKNAVLASPSHRVKVSMRSPRMLPLVSIVDPELTLSMTPAVTAATGMDALTQLLEGYVTKRSNPLTDSLCIEGLKRAARSLRSAYQDGDNLNARIDMSLASLFSGLVLANAGLGAVHGIAGPLGGMHPAPHGGVCAKLLPIVMEGNVTALQKRDHKSPLLSRYQRVAAILTGSESASINDGIQELHNLVDELKIPPLSNFGLSTDHIPDLIERSQKASSMKGNPVQLSDSELQQILEKAIV